MSLLLTWWSSLNSNTFQELIIFSKLTKVSIFLNIIFQIILQTAYSNDNFVNLVTHSHTATYILILHPLRKKKAIHEVRTFFFVSNLLFLSFELRKDWTRGFYFILLSYKSHSFLFFSFKWFELLLISFSIKLKIFKIKTFFLLIIWKNKKICYSKNSIKTEKKQFLIFKS